MSKLFKIPCAMRIRICFSISESCPPKENDFSAWEQSRWQTLRFPHTLDRGANLKHLKRVAIRRNGAQKVTESGCNGQKQQYDWSVFLKLQLPRVSLSFPEWIIFYEQFYYYKGEGEERGCEKHNRTKQTNKAKHISKLSTVFGWVEFSFVSYHTTSFSCSDNLAFLTKVVFFLIILNFFFGKIILVAGEKWRVKKKLFLLSFQHLLLGRKWFVFLFQLFPLLLLPFYMFIFVCICLCSAFAFCCVFFLVFWVHESSCLGAV